MNSNRDESPPGGAESHDSRPVDIEDPVNINELKAWLDLLQQAAAAGSALSKLAMLELRLALADGRRLILLTLLILPLLVLAWMGLSVLLGWLAYQYSQSVTLGLGMFLAVQLITLATLLAVCRRYRKSLSLPVTRRHLQSYLEGSRNGAQATEN